MTDLTPETIAHLRELDAERSASPWRSAEQTHDDWTGIQDNYSALGSMLKRVDAEFIAAAANHMGALLDAAEARDSYIDMFGVLKQAAIDMRDQRDEARSVIEQVTVLAEDLADHGLRFDLNPTMPFDAGPMNWLTYIARMDKRVREIGAQLRAALAPATQREEGEPKVRVDSHGSWLPERVGGEE